MATDKRKFKRTKDQDHPTNPTRDNEVDTNDFDIDEKTVKDQQKKK